MRLCGSTPTVGSSSSRIAGSCSSAAARLSRRFMPPLNVATCPWRGRSGPPRRAPHPSQLRAAYRACRRARRRAPGSRAPKARRAAPHPAAPGPVRRFTGSVSLRTTPPSISTSPRSGLQQSGDHRDCRRLAGAVRPQQSDHLARTRGEGDFVDGDQVAVAFVETLHLEHAVGRLYAIAVRLVPGVYLHVLSESSRRTPRDQE